MLTCRTCADRARTQVRRWTAALALASEARGRVADWPCHAWSSQDRASAPQRRFPQPLRVPEGTMGHCTLPRGPVRLPGRARSRDDAQGPGLRLATHQHLPGPETGQGGLRQVALHGHRPGDSLFLPFPRRGVRGKASQEVASRGSQERSEDPGGDGVTRPTGRRQQPGRSPGKP